MIVTPFLIFCTVHPAIRLHLCLTRNIGWSPEPALPRAFILRSSRARELEMPCFPAVFAINERGVRDDHEFES